MSNEHPLTLKQLVWAKLQPHPWWPGKIAQILKQNNQDIYKISFFAEPTYAYLRHHQLIRYECFDQSLNRHCPQNKLHQKAVQIAQNYFDKIVSTSSLRNSCETIKQLIQQAVVRLEEPCQEKEEVGTQNLTIPEDVRLVQQTDYSKTIQRNALHQRIDDISVDNVIYILENNGKKQQKSDYSYETRKEEIRYQEQLKQQLLKKYNLLYLGKQNGTPTFKSHHQKSIIQITPPLLYSKHTKKIHKNKVSNYTSNQISVLRIHCLHKLTHLLKNSQDSLQAIKQRSLQTINRIILLSQNNHMKLKSLFITLVKTVSRCAANINCEEKLSQFGQYLERMQNEKHEDEEGSRLTQVEPLMN